MLVSVPTERLGDGAGADGVTPCVVTGLALAVSPVPLCSSFAEAFALSDPTCASPLLRGLPANEKPPAGMVNLGTASVLAWDLAPEARIELAGCPAKENGLERSALGALGGAAAGVAAGSGAGAPDGFAAGSDDGAVAGLGTGSDAGAVAGFGAGSDAGAAAGSDAGSDAGSVAGTAVGILEGATSMSPMGVALGALIPNVSLDRLGATCVAASTGAALDTGSALTGAVMFCWPVRLRRPPMPLSVRCGLVAMASLPNGRSEPAINGGGCDADDLGVIEP